MATITLNYDAHNVSMRKAIDLLLSMGAVKVNTPTVDTEPTTAPAKTKMSSIDISLKEIEKGKVNTYNSSKEMFEKLGITL